MPNDSHAPLIGLPGRQIKHPRPAEVDRTLKKDPSPSRPPKPADYLGITIDTSVGRHRAPAPTQVFPQPVHVRSESSDTCSSNLGKKRNHVPAPLKLDDISPFDRYVPIALAVPNTAEVLVKEEPRLRQPSPSRNGAAPAMTLAPTDNVHKPHGSPADPRRTIHPRPSSSVYTRAVSTFSKYSRTPRVKADSRLLSKFALTSPLRSPLKSASRLSEMTMIDDDDSPCIVPFQKTPTALRRPRTRASSLDTNSATPRRSIGWWNLLASPIFVHTNSVRSKRVQTPREKDIPEVPLLEDRAAIDGANGETAPDAGDEKDALDKHQTMPTFYYQPTRGEAAGYYDMRLSFRTAVSQSPLYEEGLEVPRDGKALFAGAAGNIQRDNSQRTNFTADSGESTKQVGSSPEPDTIRGQASPKSRAAFCDSRKQTQEFSPRQTPPKSAAAQFFSDDELMSPVSATPIVQTASIGRFQSARAITPIREEHSPNPQAAPSASASASAAPRALMDNSYLQPPAISQPAPRQPYAPSTLAMPAPPPRTYSPEHEETLRQLTRAPSMAPFHVVTAKSSTPPPLPPPVHREVLHFDSPPREASPESFISSHHKEAPYFPPPPRESSPERFIGRQHRPKGPSFLSRLLAKTETMHYKSPYEPPRDPGSKRWTRGRLFVLATGIILFLVIFLTLIFSLTVHLKHTDMPVQAQWVNLTSYPPIPTGISTVSGTKTTTSNKCVQPNDMWTCSAPSGSPDFRLEIRFNDGAVVHNNTRRSTSGAALASFLTRRDTFADLLYTPSPAPPSLDEQSFLGNTTGGNSMPYAGEPTPFSLSLVSPAQANKTHTRRASTADIPAPILLPNSSAQQLLYPLVVAQPLRLYDRGQKTEHYGFYAYFDKAATARLPSALAQTAATAAAAPANAVCTFAQTRLLVRIWTRAGASPIPAHSGTDFAGAGSFPYPVTVALDRHGGDAAHKGVYCYGLDRDGNVLRDAKAVMDEDRGVGGVLINPAAAFAESTGVEGGVDGGTGGCGCQWTNSG